MSFNDDSDFEQVEDEPAPTTKSGAVGTRATRTKIDLKLITIEPFDGSTKDGKVNSYTEEQALSTFINHAYPRFRVDLEAKLDQEAEDATGELESAVVLLTKLAKSDENLTLTSDTAKILAKMAMTRNPELVAALQLLPPRPLVPVGTSQTLCARHAMNEVTRQTTTIVMSPSKPVAVKFKANKTRAMIEDTEC
ncbi:hypothetical protein GN958_ATG13859 [Phytophthora infestans]|uniref:Uncharacterized protein n=1 Tax=Phytophthora infestans TaxID=4787 RepID=A0A8S9UC42_PHYIN|nr:hypothetical protein GN958_ATG13859 [Phytophthora infestans]